MQTKAENTYSYKFKVYHVGLLLIKIPFRIDVDLVKSPSTGDLFAWLVTIQVDQVLHSFVPHAD